MSMKKRVAHLEQAAGQASDEITMIYYVQMNNQCGQWVERPHSAMILPSAEHEGVTLQWRANQRPEVFDARVNEMHQRIHGCRLELEDWSK